MLKAKHGNSDLLSKQVMASSFPFLIVSKEIWHVLSVTQTRKVRCFHVSTVLHNEEIRYFLSDEVSCIGVTRPCYVIRIGDVSDNEIGLESHTFRPRSCTVCSCGSFRSVPVGKSECTQEIRPRRCGYCVLAFVNGRRTPNSVQRTSHKLR